MTVVGAPMPADDASADEAVELARTLLTAAEHLQTRAERRQRERLGRLLGDTDGRELLFELTDQVLRIDRRRRAAKRFASIVRRHSTQAAGAVDRFLLRAGALLAPVAPPIVMPLVQRRIVAEARQVVLPAEDPAFSRYVAKRTTAGVRLNVNPLGEAILSEAEADVRLAMILKRIVRPDVDYVSLKISAVVANLDPLAFEHSTERICDRLRTVYRAGQAADPVTFVNLDMEEYRDLELSLAAFMNVLDEPEFESIDAGIVLQAYVPDSHAALKALGRWAADRYDRAGGRIKIRIVKGANLAMEQVESELHGWTQAPYPTKAEVDASFKVMLDSALRAEWAEALRIGIASHNLFDIAWALTNVRHRDPEAIERVEFEMLEGMAPAQARAVLAEVHDLLLYAPVVDRADIDASIAYLSRRLDENTQPANFLRALFDLTLDSPEWREQEARFRSAVADRTTVSTDRRRQPLPGATADQFRNEPDSDVTDPEVRAAIASAEQPEPKIAEVDDTGTIDGVLRRAVDATDDWAAATSDRRRRLVRDAASLMRERRFETLAVMAAETGKTVLEGDPEVSEAIDFAEYYAGPGIDLLDEVAGRGRGVTLVVGPWNFPYAIPCGGVFAALAAGNAVVLKPAPEAVRVAATFVEQLYAAGVPEELVQLIVCEDGPVGRHLVTHPDLDTVVLTGSWETAALFKSWKPDLRLFAETSGKNSMVITATADLDLAIADLVRSAFGHAGQKCSAASLAIVEAPVYDDDGFHRRLHDAVASWRVGWPSDPATMMGPLIAPPHGDLERALTTLDAGEAWLLEPQQLDDSGRLWSPGVRTGVRPGGWFHLTECFGPVLGLMRAKDLDHALELQNATQYGLTGGLHSLDPDEIDEWLDRVAVGNAYVNKPTTGAVVRRQPFGGWKRSSVGPGSKAGGPNYILQFAAVDPDLDRPIAEVRASYEAAWRDEFAIEHDPSGLRAEANVFRYRPADRVVAVHDGRQDASLERLRCAAEVTGVELVERDLCSMCTDDLLGELRPDDRVRLLADADGELLARLSEAGIWCSTAVPTATGRVELLAWVREQSVSRTLHRHGRLPDPGRR